MLNVGRSVKALVLAAAMLAAGGMVGAVELTENGQAYDNAGWGGVTVMRSNSQAGDFYANGMGASINAQRTFRRSLPSIYSYSQTAHYQDRADAGSVGALANIDSANYYVVCPTTMCAPGSKWVMWDVPFYTKTTQKTDGVALGYEQNVSGFSTGLSRMLGETSAIGIAVGYDARKLKTRDAFRQTGKSDTFHMALYGGTNIGCFFLDAYAGYSRAWNRSNRAYVADSSAVGKANYNDTVLSAGLKASYVWILGNDVRITPSAGVDLSHIRNGRINEHNWVGGVDGGVVATTGKKNYTNVAVPLMVSLNKTFSSSWLAFGGYESLWTPEIRAGYVPVFGSKRADLRVTDPTAGNDPYSVKSAKLAKSYGTVGAGAKIKLRNKYIFALDYDLTVASKYTNHTFTAMYGVSF